MQRLKPVYFKSNADSAISAMLRIGVNEKHP